MYTEKEKERIKDEGKLFFPLFMDLTEKQILVIGAGKIATRRIRTMVDFVGSVTVVAPRVEPQILELADRNENIIIFERCFSDRDLDGKYIVFAATDNHELNEDIVKKCNERGILVNAVHNQNLCDFYFPGIVRKDSLVAGITACGSNHVAAKEATALIRKAISKMEK